MHMGYGNLNQKHSMVGNNNFKLVTTTADGAVIFNLNKNNGVITYELDPNEESGEKNDWDVKEIRKLVEVLRNRFVTNY